MERSIDPRPTQERAPAFDVEEQRLEARVPFLDRGCDLLRAKQLANEAVRGVSAAPNGDQVWTIPDGRTAHGPAGRAAMVEYLAAREHLASFGAAPREQVFTALADRGVTREEAEAHLPEHRIRRQEDGSISWTPATGERTRIGGAEVVTEAVRRVYDLVQRTRGTAPAGPVRVPAPVIPDAAIEAEVRARHRFAI